MSTPIVPSFDDAAGSGRKLAIICSKGNLDMAYPGLILANAALGEGVETHLFFTFWGFDIINKATMGDLKFTFVGNTAMHMPGHNSGIHHMLGALPGATAGATAMMKKMIADLDVPEVPEFLELLTASGCHMWACRMSADMNKLTEDDLYDGVEAIISASDFIEITDGAQLLFI
ncbi:MAG TPA: DsrE/DsrF/DrsH-like family protein [Dermatophilaceae bacterium]|jgi:peroxiredoxin family protein|nr:DsrE/DsrF/DrsH-like family protein [Actinomycetales bacterium]HMT32614.1 DsrE/DsrF/DrsH-like family protein [Dermatophilaceae bacterium]HMT89318.1 DsrE/DsrF/DrsH-like family protein [Dermatophilaceae bacterium]